MADVRCKKSDVKTKLSLQPSYIIHQKAPSKLLTPKNHLITMKNKETWKTILQIIGSIIASVITALSTTSCMGYGPF